MQKQPLVHLFYKNRPKPETSLWLGIYQPLDTVSIFKLFFY